MALEKWKPLPTANIWYEHQIGGHGLVYEKKGKFLMDGEDTVLKPVQRFPKGLVELKFYQQIFDQTCSDKTLIDIRKFLPTYKELYYDIKENAYYIGMDNILKNVKHPSIIDIKVGRKSYVPGASQEKISCEIAKYFYRESVGFLITGIKVYDPLLEENKYFDRFYGCALDTETVYSKGILCFLGTNAARARQIAKFCTHHLANLLAWFEKQTRFSFYSSSILLAYGDGPLTSPEDVIVKWVDFTHVLDSQKDASLPEQIDDNFIFGLRNLIHLLQTAEADLPAPGGRPLVVSSPFSSSEHKLHNGSG